MVTVHHYITQTLTIRSILLYKTMLKHNTVNSIWKTQGCHSKYSTFNSKHENSSGYTFSSILFSWAWFVNKIAE